MLKVLIQEAQRTPSINNKEEKQNLILYSYIHHIQTSENQK